MRIHIIGPNLPDQSKGDFHVHAEGCTDVRRHPNYAFPDFDPDKKRVYTVTSQVDAARILYEDQIHEGEMTAEDGVHDMWFAPCTRSLS